MSLSRCAAGLEFLRNADDDLSICFAHDVLVLWDSACSGESSAAAIQQWRESARKRLAWDSWKPCARGRELPPPIRENPRLV